MRKIITIILSWLAVTTIFVVAMFFDGVRFSIYNMLMLLLPVGLFSAIYFGVIGTPILYIIFRRKTINRATFVYAGVLASLPMLLLCIYSREIEWIIATVFAGPIGGLVFALRLPNQAHS